MPCPASLATAIACAAARLSTSNRSQRADLRFILHNMTAPLAMSTAECVQDPQQCVDSRSHAISFDHREGALQLHRGDPGRSQPASSALLLPSRSNWHLLLPWCNGQSSSTRCDESIYSRAGAALNVPNEPRLTSRRPAAHELCQWKLYGYLRLHQSTLLF